MLLLHGGSPTSLAASRDNKPRTFWRSPKARRYTRLSGGIMIRWLTILAFLASPLCGLAAGATEALNLTRDKSLSAWRQSTGAWASISDATLRTSDPKMLELKPGEGAIANGPEGRTCNLLSKAEFGDCEVHVEFLISKDSNSGVYLMGRYEVQIYDSYGKVKDAYPGIECGGIYPRWVNERNENGHSPRVNASKPAGQWQTFDITFRAPRFDASGTKIANGVFLKVVHNGQVIHENVEVTGPTR